MTQTEQQAQQSRTERIGLAVTADEKKAVEFVALARNLAGSSLLFREMSLPEIMAEYARLRRLIGDHNDQANGHGGPRGSGESSEAVMGAGYGDQ